MLILNRKIDEAIVINENITIRILDIVDGKVKIGIDAPRDINILRLEVYDAVKSENQASISTDDNLLDLIKELNNK
jgi:carbon storage regulator